MGQSKYKALDMAYAFEGLGAADDLLVESVQKAYSELGIDCTISR
jgi:hypothetical protein